MMDLLHQRPPGVPDAAAAGGYSILPEQTAKQLYVSEVHSRLDRVLNFLQRDVGYCFVSDAKPERRGSVTMKDPVKAMPAPWRNSKKSVRLPRSAISGGSGSEEPDSDGVYRTPSGALDRRRLDAECRDFRIGPDAARYAQYPDDLVLVARFVRVLIQASPSFADRAKDQGFVKRVLQGVRLMHLCEFNYSDVVVTLAYASAYFASTFKSIGHLMTGAEAANVCTLLIFLAHSFILDETCPLRCWQTHIFKKYCTLKVLDAALFRLFNLRGFRLRLSLEEEGHALKDLLVSATGDEGWDGTTRLDELAANALRDRLFKTARDRIKQQPVVAAAATQAPWQAESPKRGDAAGGLGAGDAALAAKPGRAVKQGHVPASGRNRGEGDGRKVVAAPAVAEVAADDPKNGIRTRNGIHSRNGQDAAGLVPVPGVPCLA